jgi:hypothetical protein
VCSADLDRSVIGRAGLRAAMAERPIATDSNSYDSLSECQIFQSSYGVDGFGTLPEQVMNSYGPRERGGRGRSGGHGG